MVLSHSSCNCSDGKRMRVALWVRLFALWLFHLHCGCLMENTKTWLNGIWKTCPILRHIQWEHLVTHMALLLSLADDIHPFTGLHLVDMSGYVLPCLAERMASFTTHQTCAATHVFAAPMLHQFLR